MALYNRTYKLGQKAAVVKLNHPTLRTYIFLQAAEDINPGDKLYWINPHFNAILADKDWEPKGFCLADTKVSKNSMFWAEMIE